MGHTLSLEFQAIWKILVFGILLGAGLPTIFAFGVRSMAYGQGGEAELHETGVAMATPHPIGRVVGTVCFAVVLLAIALALTFLVVTGSGKALSFSHVYPTIVAKH
jgi:hypothetical protein